MPCHHGSAGGDGRRSRGAAGARHLPVTEVAADLVRGTGRPGRPAVLQRCARRRPGSPLSSDVHCRPSWWAPWSGSSAPPGSRSASSTATDSWRARPMRCRGWAARTAGCCSRPGAATPGRRAQAQRRPRRPVGAPAARAGRRRRRGLPAPDRRRRRRRRGSHQGAGVGAGRRERPTPQRGQSPHSATTPTTWSCCAQPTGPYSSVRGLPGLERLAHVRRIPANEESIASALRNELASAGEAHPLPTIVSQAG